MKTTLHVIYPKDHETTFDPEYFIETHAPMTRRILDEYTESMIISKGIENYPSGAPGVYFIVTFVFKSRESFDKSDRVAGQIHKDIENFYNKRPRLLLGEVVN